MILVMQLINFAVIFIHSGVDADHPKFGGRVTKGDSILKTPPGDSLGHGTHVAGK